MVNKKRIAYCIYGQVRFVDKLKEYFEYLVENDKYTVDIFIATWADFDNSLFDIKFKESLFLKEIELTQNWDKDTGNTPRMAYLLSRVVELKKITEITESFKYDYVVLSRPDVIVKKSSFYECLSKLNFDQSNKPCVFTLSEIRLEEEEKLYRIDQDYMFIESSDAADIHSLMYSFFYVHYTYKKFNTNYREGGHWIHPYFFKHFNFDIYNFHLPVFLIRPVLENQVFIDNFNRPDLLEKLVENKNYYKKNKKSTVNFKEKIV